MTIFGSYSDRGRVKSVNQDACCYLDAQSKAGRVVCAIVCDGVGGLSKGELASATVVRRFADWFSTQFPLFLEYNAGDSGLLDSLRNIWDTLIQMASEDINRYGKKSDVMLGTTFTGMIVVGNRFLIGHVGDCRAYAVTDQGAFQLTHDQTLVAQQVAAGQLTPEEAAHHPKRNVILQSIGTSESVDPEFIMGEVDERATYVFCCDGLYSRLKDGELQSLFAPGAIGSEESLNDACISLVKEVMARGEKDNITILAFTGADIQSTAKRQSRFEDAPDEQGLLEEDGETIVVQSSVPVDASQDEDSEALTEVVDPADSPTIVVKGKGGEN